MAKKAKGNRVQVILECTEMKDSGMPGTSRYITTKNRKNLLIHIVLIAGIAVTVFPFLWMIFTSLRHCRNLCRLPPTNSAGKNYLGFL